MFNGKEIAWYRNGEVIRTSLRAAGCCRLVEKPTVCFEYIRVVFADGEEKLIYEDTEGKKFVEDNFVANRFTSYHEFFTTKEEAIEDRDVVQLTYYIRRPEEDYVIMKLDEAREILKEAKQEETTTTTIGEYLNCPE